MNDRIKKILQIVLVMLIMVSQTLFIGCKEEDSKNIQKKKFRRLEWTPISHR